MSEDQTNPDDLNLHLHIGSVPVTSPPSSENTLFTNENLSNPVDKDKKEAFLEKFKTREKPKDFKLEDFENLSQTIPEIESVMEFLSDKERQELFSGVQKILEVSISDIKELGLSPEKEKAFIQKEIEKNFLKAKYHVTEILKLTKSSKADFSRPYLHSSSEETDPKQRYLFKREVAIQRMHDEITKRLEAGENLEEVLSNICIINSDMNGLSALNTFGHEEVGNKAIAAYSHVLRNGRAVREFGKDFKSEAFMQGGGDEFLLVTFTDKENTEKLISGLRQDVMDIDVTQFLNFQDDDVINILKFQKLSVPPIPTGAEKTDFKYTMSGSFAAASLMEAFDSLDFLKLNLNNLNYENMITMIINEAFRISDERAGADKKKVKDELVKRDRYLGYLYDIKAHANHAVDTRSGKQSPRS